MKRNYLFLLLFSGLIMACGSPESEEPDGPTPTPTLGNDVDLSGTWATQVQLRPLADLFVVHRHMSSVARTHIHPARAAGDAVWATEHTLPPAVARALRDMAGRLRNRRGGERWQGQHHIHLMTDASEEAGAVGELSRGRIGGRGHIVVRVRIEGWPQPLPHGLGEQIWREAQAVALAVAKFARPWMQRHPAVPSGH